MWYIKIKRTIFIMKNDILNTLLAKINLEEIRGYSINFEPFAKEVEVLKYIIENELLKENK